MKIFYAVQATGNGHISRATELYPHLSKHGQVDIFLSGNNSTLDFPFPVKYKSKGLSLHYSKCGGLNYMDILKNTRPVKIIKEAIDLPLKKYDMIINDFECITSLACKLQNKNSVQFGHQASFKSSHTPRPKKINNIGEIVLKHYSSSTKNVGLHFEPYDDFIFPPVIKKDFMNKKVSNLKHVTVYLPAFQESCLLEAFQQLSNIEFHWFLPTIKEIIKVNNITYFPIYHKLFNESLLSCDGLITGGGFETPSEALYLGKKLMSIPIKDHYEQQCNAAALKKLGVTVLETVDETFQSHVANWYCQPNIELELKANNIQETIQYIVDTYPYKKTNQLEENMLFI